VPAEKAGNQKAIAAHCFTRRFHNSRNTEDPQDSECFGVLSKQAEVTGTGGVEFYPRSPAAVAIVTATGPIVHNDPARPPSLLALTDIAVSPSKSTGEAAAFFPRVLTAVPSVFNQQATRLAANMTEARCIGLHLFQVSGPWPEGSRRKMSPY
jgi:hypothetical protein